MTLEQQFEQTQQKRDNGYIKEAITSYQQIREAAMEAGNDWLAAECEHMIGVACYNKITLKWLLII